MEEVCFTSIHDVFASAPIFSAARHGSPSAVPLVAASSSCTILRATSRAIVRLTLLLDGQAPTKVLSCG